jgi:hypothetical protein
VAGARAALRQPRRDSRALAHTDSARRARAARPRPPPAPPPAPQPGRLPGEGPHLARRPGGPSPPRRELVGGCARGGPDGVARHRPASEMEGAQRDSGPIPPPRAGRIPLRWRSLKTGIVRPARGVSEVGAAGDRAEGRCPLRERPGGRSAPRRDQNSAAGLRLLPNCTHIGEAGSYTLPRGV